MVYAISLDDTLIEELVIDIYYTVDLKALCASKITLETHIYIYKLKPLNIVGTLR